MAKKKSTLPIPAISLSDFPYSSAIKNPDFHDYVNHTKSTCINLCDFLKNQNITPLVDIIAKLQKKPWTPFSKTDVSDLEVFTSKIDQFVHCNNIVSTFKQSPALDLPTLFNDIAGAKDFESYEKTPKTKTSFSKEQQGALQHLFSIIKHCKEPGQYPIKYKQWEILNKHCGWSTSKTKEYDCLCELYNNVGIPTTDSPKQVYFAAYIDYLAHQLMNVIAPGINSYSESKLKDLFFTYEDVIAALFKPHSINLILYGPPGTGKTYNTVNEALDIIQPEWKAMFIDQKENGINGINDEREYALQRFNYFKARGQIVFTTFHQSMSYEDFIEGIKPKVTGNNMTYEVQDGLFKNIYTNLLFQCVIDTFKMVHPKGSSIFSGSGISVKIKDYVEKKSKEGNMIPCIQYEWGSKGHTDVVQICAIQKIIKNGKNFEFETYEKECVAISSKRTAVKNATGSLSNYYNIIYEEFKEIYEICKKLPRVLIIDEINRGNVSQIFGELITLIEKDKRLCEKEAMTATLPYSQKPFGVPNNLYIIGTMNTADRSVEALDTALRRRFSFKEMMPDTSKVKGDIEITYTDKSSASKKERILFSELLSTINERIALLKDREHQIGHSYFMGYEKAGEVKKWLKKVFKDNIIPLLQEYFYGDYKKIYYVLGGEKVNELKPNPDAGFVLIQEMPKAIQAVFAGDVDDSEVDIAEARYEINTIDENFNIDIAIAKLMKKI